MKTIITSLLIFVLVGCGSFQAMTPTQELTAKVAVKIAVKKYIKRGDVEQRSQRILEVLEDAGSVVDAAETFSLGST